MLRSALATFDTQKEDSDIMTDDLSSDSADFFVRKRNFSIIKRRLEAHAKENYLLFRGNDLKYNNYIRKLTKLSAEGKLNEDSFIDWKALQREKLKNIDMTDDRC